MVQCDLAWLDGSGPVRESPRPVLKAQVDAAAELGFDALAGTELEFIVFEDTYEQAWDRRYRGLTGANQYNVDYSLLGGTRVEPLLRDIRNEMHAAGVAVESAKGECNLGQHEIAFKYDEVVAHRATTTSSTRTRAKEIAAQHGQSLTFMAKFDEREGNSCHIHLCLRGTDGEIVLPTTSATGGRRACSSSSSPGIQATMPELTLLYAPNINSYKRFQPGSFAPTAIAWGTTTAPARCGSSATAPACGSRTACPAATSTPTSPWPAMLAGGLHGIREELAARGRLRGQRLRVRQGPRPDDARRGPRPVRRLGDRPRRLR